MEAVVLGEGKEQLGAQFLVQQHHARARRHGVTQVEAAAALARQPDQVLQPLPLELAPSKEHLQLEQRRNQEFQ